MKPVNTIQRFAHIKARVMFIHNGNLAIYEGILYCNMNTLDQWVYSINYNNYIQFLPGETMYVEIP